MANTCNPNPAPDWEAVAAFFGLDTSFQYTDEQRAAHTKAFVEAQAPDIAAALSHVWQLWCADQGLTCVSADEMLGDEQLTGTQAAVVASFCRLWELTV